jgi:hypothetical protein
MGRRKDCGYSITQRLLNIKTEKRDFIRMERVYSGLTII